MPLKLFSNFPKLSLYLATPILLLSLLLTFGTSLQNSPKPLIMPRYSKTFLSLLLTFGTPLQNGPNAPPILF